MPSLAPWSPSFTYTTLFRSLGGIPDYQSFDKWADQVYMVCFLVVALRWQGIERSIAIGLYAFRLVGFVAFEMTGARPLLLLFPNVFEFWFLLVAALHHLPRPVACDLASF